jgi:hypothetical protein
LGNLHRDRDEAQLGGEGSLGEEMDGEVIDLDFELVQNVSSAST